MGSTQGESAAQNRVPKPATREGFPFWRAFEDVSREGFEVLPDPFPKPLVPMSRLTMQLSARPV